MLYFDSEQVLRIIIIVWNKFCSKLLVCFFYRKTTVLKNYIRCIFCIKFSFKKFNKYEYKQCYFISFSKFIIIRLFLFLSEKIRIISFALDYN